MSDYDKEVPLSIPLNILHARTHRTLSYLSRQISTNPDIPDNTKQFYGDILENLVVQIADLYEAKGRLDAL